MKVNFPLEDIELNIDDDILEVAESLLQRGSLKNLQEVEKGLWTAALIEEDARLEVEVQIAGSKVRGYTCECPVFKRYGVCQHIAATLHALRERRRRFVEDRETVRLAKLKKIEKDKSPQQLTVPNILKHTDKEALIEFVAHYARQNNQFALALKVHFTGEINKENNEANYKTLIDNTFKNAKTPKGSISPKGWGEILTVVDQLRQKSEVATAQDDLQQVFVFANLVLPFLHRLLRREDVQKAKIVKRQEFFVNLLRGALNRPMAQELEKKIYMFVANEFQEQIRFDFIDFFADTFFAVLLKNSNRYEKIVEIINNNIPKNKKTNKFIYEIEENNINLYNRLVELKIRTLQYAGQTELAAKIIFENSNTIDTLLSAIRISFEQQDRRLAKLLVAKGLAQFEKSPWIHQLQEFALKLAIAENDRQKIILLAKSLVKQTLKIEFYDTLCRQNISTTEKNALITEIEALPYSFEKRDLLANIFFAEDMFDRLFAFIQHLQSFELLRFYGIELWKVEPQKTIFLHEEILQDYLNAHLGKPSAQRVRVLFEIYIESEGIDLVKIMTHFLKKKFPNRFSLLEELEKLELENDDN